MTKVLRFFTTTSKACCKSIFCLLVTDFVIISSQNRRIVVREPSGVLREATWTERDKMNFIYFPKPEQKYELPTMLQDEHLPVRCVHVHCQSMLFVPPLKNV